MHHKILKKFQTSTETLLLNSVLVAFAVLVPTTVLLLLSYGSRYRVPDYGDLWRWAMGIQSDRSLTFRELFSETSIFGHNSVLSIWVSNFAAQQQRYEILWAIGALSIALCAALIAGFCYYFYPARADDRQPTWHYVVPIAGGLSLIRIDVPWAYYNSLLIFEQLYYLLSTVAMLCAAYAQARYDGGFPVSSWTFAAIGLTIFVADAPAGPALFAIVGLAFASAILRRTWAHLVRLSVLAIVVSLLKSLLRSLAGGTGSSGLDKSLLSEMFSTEVAARTLKLLGSSVVVVSRGATTLPRPGSVYLFVGGLVLLTLIVACVYAALTRDQQTPNAATLINAGIILLTSSSLSAVFIAIERDIGTGYDVSRFVRSTQFIVPGIVLIGAALVSDLRKPVRVASTLMLASVAVVLALRLISVPSFLDEDVAQRQADARAALICEGSNANTPWKTVWAGAPEDGNFEKSELYDQWYSASC